LFRKLTNVSSHRSYTTRKITLSLCVTNSCHAMKTYGGTGWINLRILDLATSWGWVVSFSPLPLYYRGKSPRYPLDRRLVGPRNWPG
jgi:hypothetical protein